MRKQKTKTVDEAMSELKSYSSSEEVRSKLPVIARFVQTHRNELVRCPFCTQLIDDVPTRYTQETAVDVIRTLVGWARRNGRHEFRMREVKDLLTHTQYANMNHLDRFAGIIYRPVNPKTGKKFGGGWYGINLERADGFLMGVSVGPLEITSNRLTGERLVTKSGYFHEFPHVTDTEYADPY